MDERGSAADLWTLLRGSKPIAIRSGTSSAGWTLSCSLQSQEFLPTLTQCLRVHSLCLEEIAAVISPYHSCLALDSIPVIAMRYRVIQHIHSWTAISNIGECFSFHCLGQSGLRALMLLLAHHDFTLLSQRREPSVWVVESLDDVWLSAKWLDEPVFKVVEVIRSEMLPSSQCFSYMVKLEVGVTHCWAVSANSPSEPHLIGMFLKTLHWRHLLLQRFAK